MKAGSAAEETSPFLLYEDVPRSAKCLNDLRQETQGRNIVPYHGAGGAVYCRVVIDLNLLGSQGLQVEMGVTGSRPGWICLPKGIGNETRRPL